MIANLELKETKNTMLVPAPQLHWITDGLESWHIAQAMHRVQILPRIAISAHYHEWWWQIQFNAVFWNSTNYRPVFACYWPSSACQRSSHPALLGSMSAPSFWPHPLIIVLFISIDSLSTVTVWWCSWKVHRPSVRPPLPSAVRPCLPSAVRPCQVRWN